MIITGQVQSLILAVFVFFLFIYLFLLCTAAITEIILRTLNGKPSLISNYHISAAGQMCIWHGSRHYPAFGAATTRASRVGVQQRREPSLTSQASQQWRRQRPFDLRPLSPIRLTNTEWSHKIFFFLKIQPSHVQNVASVRSWRRQSVHSFHKPLIISCCVKRLG